MGELYSDSDFKRRHGPLTDRGAAIAASLFDCAAIDLRDAADDAPARPRTRAIHLNRGDKPALARKGASHLASDARRTTNKKLAKADKAVRRAVEQATGA